MSTLVFLACLVSAPYSCEQHEIVADAPEIACLLAGPATLAMWVMEHPDRRIARWECRKGIGI